MDQTQFLPKDDQKKRQDDKKKKKRKQCRKETFCIIWLVLLIGAFVCLLFSFLLSDAWIVEGGYSPPSEQLTSADFDDDAAKKEVGLFANYSKHGAWMGAAILLFIALGCLALSLVTALIFYLVRMKKAAKLRHKCLKAAKISSFIAGICMVIALIIFPIGFESAKLLPCAFETTKEQAFHLCNPWETGVAIYIVIISQVCLTLAICFSSCVLSSIDEERKEKEKRKRQGIEDEWADKYGTAPLISETDMGDGKEDSMKKKKKEQPNMLDEVMVGDDMDALHMPGYLDLDEYMATARSPQACVCVYGHIRL